VTPESLFAIFAPSHAVSANQIYRPLN